MNGFDLLKERGFVYQMTDDNELPKCLNGENVTFYVGFDPTADSLHIGHLLPVMAMRILQQAGHRPIALVGGATALVGDPSGKSEMRQMLTKEDINKNAEALKSQLSRFLNFEEDGGALLLNNADWLCGVNYIDFLREIGSCFSVNKMLTAESVKQRLETGLSFIEFNYSLLQSYDFYVLMRDYGCSFQLGGQDQWGNIVAGTDLCRRKLSNQAYGMTFPLLLNSQGQKFGKSVAGAVWLDENKMSVYDYYQFWRNSDDCEVEKLLSFFTTLPMAEVREICNSGNINRAKEILGYEATCLAHGEEKAKRAYLAAGTEFGFSDPQGLVKTTSKVATISASEADADLPTYELAASELEEGIWVCKLFTDSGLCKSNSEARRHIKGNALSINGEKVKDAQYQVDKKDLEDGVIMLRFGKKQLRRIVLI